jgi:hypothetical protein
MEVVALIRCVSVYHHKDEQLVFRATNQHQILCDVITGNETWCFQYDTKIKIQNLQWKQLTSQ